MFFVNNIITTNCWLTSVYSIKCDKIPKLFLYLTRERINKHVQAHVWKRTRKKFLINMHMLMCANEILFIWIVFEIENNLDSLRANNAELSFCPHWRSIYWYYRIEWWHTRALYLLFFIIKFSTAEWMRFHGKTSLVNNLLTEKPRILAYIGTQATVLC